MSARLRWRWRTGELPEELEAHLRLDIEERVARGEDPAEARYMAMRELGNVPLIQDVTWEVTRQNAWGWLEPLLRDIRLALRRLRRSPGFAATVLLTIAIGIGANLAVFQLLYNVILAELPVSHPEELVTVHAAWTPFDHQWHVSYDAYQRLRAATGERAPLAAHSYMGEGLLRVTGVDVGTANYVLVSENYFQTLGATMAAGRAFLPSDTNPDSGEWPAVVRYGFARNLPGGVSHAVGQRILLNNLPVVIVGVAGSRFLDVLTGYPPDFWLPLEEQRTGALPIGWDSLGHGVDLKGSWLAQDGIFWLSLIGRVPVAMRGPVAAEWDAVFRADRAVMASVTTDPVAKAAALRQQLTLVPAAHGQGGLRETSALPLALLMTLSASVFLVGCLNLANLQMARLSAWEPELSLRVALGASRWRLLRQVLLEGAMLVLVGGLLAFAIGRAGSGVLVKWASSRGFALVLDMHPGLPLAVTGATLMLIALLSCGLLPALRFTRVGPGLLGGSRTRSLGQAQSRTQRWQADAMLATQVGLSLLLVTLSLCFAGTLIHWERLDVGMDREHVLVARLDMERTGFAAAHKDELPALYQSLVARLKALPGVRHAAVEMCSPLSCGWETMLYVFGDRNLSDAQVHGHEDHVGPGYFATMGIPLLRGRDFNATDNEHTQPVLIVNRAYARQLFGKADPIGHFVGYEPAPNDHRFLIIGEVADARVDGAQEEPPPVAYRSVLQQPAPIHTIEVRVSGNPAAVEDNLREALQQAAPDLPVTEIVTLQDEFSGGLGTDRLLSRLAGIYATLTLLLVAIGVYGVLSFRTQRRAGEFGIRLALGATRRHIHLLVAAQTGRILLAGIALGALLAVSALHLVRHLLYGSDGTNAAALAAAVAILAVTGFAASLIPARRAAKSDPLTALRQE